MWCALRKSRIIGPFFLKEATVNSEFYPALLQGLLIPELRQLNLLRLNLLSARRCTLPLCFEGATGTEWRLPTAVDRYSCTNCLATSFASFDLTGTFHKVTLKQPYIHRYHVLWINVRSGLQTKFMKSLSSKWTISAASQNMF